MIRTKSLPAYLPACFALALALSPALRANRAQRRPREALRPLQRTPWGDPDLQGVWPGTDMIRHAT